VRKRRSPSAFTFRLIDIHIGGAADLHRPAPVYLRRYMTRTQVDFLSSIGHDFFTCLSDFARSASHQYLGIFLMPQMIVPQNNKPDR